MGVSVGGIVGNAVGVGLGRGVAVTAGVAVDRGVDVNLCVGGDVLGGTTVAVAVGVVPHAAAKCEVQLVRLCDRNTTHTHENQIE